MQRFSSEGNSKRGGQGTGSEDYIKLYQIILSRSLFMLVHPLSLRHLKPETLQLRGRRRRGTGVRSERVGRSYAAEKISEGSRGLAIACLGLTVMG